MMDGIDKQIEALKNRQQELWDMQKPIEQELRNLYHEIENLQNKRTNHLLNGNLSFEERFEFLMREDNGMEAYQELAKFLAGMCLDSSGYSPFSGQRVISFHLSSKDGKRNSKVKESLKNILPLVKPVNVEGTKKFKIFERTLSEHGSYSLEYFKEGVWKLVIHCYGSRSVLKEWDNLDDALDYISKNHYYDIDDEEEGW